MDAVAEEPLPPVEIPADLKPLELEIIQHRLKGCARLPSLGSINSALRELLAADANYTAQISEIIRRDPSLTARLLRLVNSVYFGLSSSVNSIEEAVFYLGVRQIRQLAMVTPVIEDFQTLAGNVDFRWKDFWRHCIAVAIMSREINSCSHSATNESDYVSGLVHDVGKIVIASIFPRHFSIIHKLMEEDPTRILVDVEQDILGIDHAELGALYLEGHNLPDAMVEAARYHHTPGKASRYISSVASVHVADMLVRHADIGFSGNTNAVTPQDWESSDAWSLLFSSQSEQEIGITRACLNRYLERLSNMLEGLV